VEISNVEEVPEVAFTGDTTATWIVNPNNAAALKAKLLFMEVTTWPLTPRVMRVGHGSYGKIPRCGLQLSSILTKGANLPNVS
jgi:hypothetical protein